MNVYFQLIIAIGLEVIATTLLKQSNGFTKFFVTILCLTCYAASFYFLSLVLKTFPTGVVYAIWSGLGIVAISIVSYFFYNQKLDIPAIIGMILIVTGVIVINLFSKFAMH